MDYVTVKDCHLSLIVRTAFLYFFDVVLLFFTVFLVLIFIVQKPYTVVEVCDTGRFLILCSEEFNMKQSVFVVGPYVFPAKFF